MQSIIGAIIPAIATLLLGMFSAKIKDFTHSEANSLNRLVLRYALPLMLFSGIISSDIHALTSNIVPSLWISVTLISSTLFVFLLSYKVFNRPLSLAALRTLSITCPAVTFVGPSIMPVIFPKEAALIIAVSGLVQNIFQLPFTMVMLEKAVGEDVPVRQTLISTAKEPVVWAPLLAFILLVLPLPFTINENWLQSFKLLGQATGGIALFASGITLYYKKLKFSGSVLLNVFYRNLLIPVLIFILMVLFRQSSLTINLTTVVLAMPAASAPTIFATQYNLHEQEIASTLFISTFLTIITLGAFFIWRGL